MVDYTGPRRLHAAYSLYFLRGAPLSAALLRGAVEHIFASSGEPWPCWSFSNHDVTRVVTRWGPKEPAARRRFAIMMNVLLTSLPGTVFLYQGEELGLTHVDIPRERLVDPEAIINWPRHANRDGARTPMPWTEAGAAHGFSAGTPWLPFGPDHGALAVDRQEEDGASVLNRTRRHLAWRRMQPALHAPAVRFLPVPEPLLAFERVGGGQRLVCAFNLGPDATTMPQSAGAGSPPIELAGYGWAIRDAGTGEVSGGAV
jgi:alpha-glucosidase